MYRGYEVIEELSGKRRVFLYERGTGGDDKPVYIADDWQDVEGFIDANPAPPRKPADSAPQPAVDYSEPHAEYMATLRNRLQQESPDAADVAVTYTPQSMLEPDFFIRLCRTLELNHRQVDEHSVIADVETLQAELAAARAALQFAKSELSKIPAPIEQTRYATEIINSVWTTVAETLEAQQAAPGAAKGAGD